MTTRLEGTDLLAYLEAAEEGLTTAQLAQGAGYYKTFTSEDGSFKIQINEKPFLFATARAQGLLPALAANKPKNVTGKARAYRLKSAEKGGAVVVSGGYLEEIGIQPGQYVHVEAVKEAGELVLSLAEDSPSTPFSAASFEDDLEESEAELVAA